MIFNIIIIATCVVVLGHSFPINRIHLTSRNNAKDLYPIERYTGRENHEYKVKSTENELDKLSGETMTAEILNKISGLELPSDYEEGTKSELSERIKDDKRSFDKIGDQTENLKKQISAGMTDLDKDNGINKHESLKFCSGVDYKVKTNDCEFETRRFGHRVGWGTDVLNADTQVETSNSQVPVSSYAIVSPELTYNEKNAEPLIKEEINSAKKKRTWRRLSLHRLHRKQKNNDQRIVNKIEEQIENLKTQISEAMADLDKGKDKNKDESLNIFPRVDSINKRREHEVRTSMFSRGTKLKTEF